MVRSGALSNRSPGLNPRVPVRSRASASTPPARGCIIASFAQEKRKMPDVETRLVGCFLTVFPQLSEADIRGVSQERLEQWDSIAAITLVNVIEEEFSTQIDY